MRRPDVWLTRCEDEGFTPGRRDVASLLAAWHELQSGNKTQQRRASKVIAKALTRGDLGIVNALQRGWDTIAGPERAFRLRVLGQLAQRHRNTSLTAFIGPCLRDADPRVVREAARALAKLDDASAYLIDLLDVAQQANLPERRAATEALGRHGGPRIAHALAQLTGLDPDLDRRITEALALIDRRQQREHAHTRLNLHAPLPTAMTLAWRCRQGAAPIVFEQAKTRLETLHLTRPAPQANIVLGHGAPTLAELYRVRSATEVALVTALPPGPDLVTRAIAGLQDPALIDALQAWTEGPPRFRLQLTGGGRQRGTVWAIVCALQELPLPLINDTRNVPWTIEINTDEASIACLPRRSDPRFTYRRAHGPASTHPSLAALMAWAAAPTPGDVVWDPFCGTGTELVEAAHLAASLSLRGTEIDPAAIEAAHANLRAAAIDPTAIDLRPTSALAFPWAPQSVDVILSNPPMGRRVIVNGGHRQLLTEAIGVAARALRPGGRAVWLSPAPRTTRQAGEAHGLLVDDLPAIDMGGFTATPQRHRKPPRSGSTQH